MNTSTTTASKNFVLSRRHQKGQVAIFVALIFQVIFVFFALLINVGLLVHHKINLQQSTDLAAYYGAMKQAESLNAISHVNFQIRQAWKLLTWRYRVLGTFGFQGEGAASQKFPFEQGATGGFTYNGGVNTKCATGDGVQDIPFFCVGHSGFDGWKGGSDTSCRINCASFTNAKLVRSIPGIGGVNLSYGGTGAPQIDNAINQVNNQLQHLCADVSKIGGTTFSRFLAAYIVEATQRKATVEMLAKNLSSDVAQQVDLDGGKVLDGAKTTLMNNLTEANKTGVGFISAINGLHEGECAYQNGSTSNTRKEFLKKIEFEFLNYFIHYCDPGAGEGQRYKPESLYTANNTVRTIFGLGPDSVNALEAVFNENRKHIIGFEKNPNCVEYYAVKASTTPKIPFLPISAVKLNAISVFKPFGGSVGPRFGKQDWGPADSQSSYVDADASSKVDQTLPLRKAPDASMADDIRGAMLQQPNFSLFVGDKLGLRDSRYIAAYHSLLAMRDPANNSYYNNSIPNSQNRLSGANGGPKYSDWQGIESINSATYDSLARQGSLARALEITAVAPNQFDLTYYSIDPDFYNNYFVKIYRNFSAIKAAAGNAGPDEANKLRPDFGGVLDTGNLTPANANEPLQSATTFSVKDQIFLKNVMFNKQPITAGPERPQKYIDHFPFLATYQASVLTGWTFKNFSDFNSFPDEILSSTTTMSFAQCADAWNSHYKDTPSQIDAPDNYRTPKNARATNPPTPGNCVTGGRTGYSVKMVTPSILSLTPPNGQTPILNPIPQNFLSF